mgnify:FL=1
MGTKRKEVKFTKQELQDYCAGKITMFTLADKHGVSKDTISARLSGLNRDDVKAAMKRNRDKSNVKMTDAILASIIDDYEDGMKMEDIVDKYHMTAPTINKYLRQQGIPVRNRPPKSKLQVLTRQRDASKVRIPKTPFTIPHRMMTISMRQQQCSA